MPASPSTRRCRTRRRDARGGRDHFRRLRPRALGRERRTGAPMPGARTWTAMPKEHDGCYYLFPEPRRPDGYRFAFMMEEGKFGRIDVRTADIAAPGGGKVGMDKAALKAPVPGRERDAAQVRRAQRVPARDGPEGRQGCARFRSGSVRESDGLAHRRTAAGRLRRRAAPDGARPRARLPAPTQRKGARRCWRPGGCSCSGCCS